MKKNLKVIACLILMIGVSTLAEAQIFKKIERRLNRKIEQKIDQKIDKEIDKAFEDKKEEEDKKTSSAGSVILHHGNSYGTVNIEEVTNPVVERNNNGYLINAAWRTHEVDIFDGLSIKIKTDQNIRHDESNTGERFVFKIPDEASLTVGYDPQLPYYSQSKDDFKRGVSDDYQDVDFLSGEIAIDVLDANHIQISFSGEGKFIERINGKETFYTAKLTGALDAEQPTFRDNTTGVKKEEEVSVTSWDDMVPETTNTTSNIPGVYQFTFQTDLLVTDVKEGQSYNISYLLNPDVSYTAIKADMSDYDASAEGESIIVIDGDDSHIFMETAGMKIRMSQNMMQGQQVNPADQMADYDYTKIQKTGKTKIILGATCYEYTMNDDEFQMELWAAPEIKLPNWFIQNAGYVDGHIMEYTITTKDGEMNSKVIAIHDQINVTINGSDYKKMF